MSVYNVEKYIKETINTILEQSYEDFELIVVDDGSTDKTLDIINSFNDARIKVYELKENKGVGYALNYGLEKCTGEYIAKVDGDDLYHKDRFKLQKEFLDNNPDIALVKSLVEYFPDNEQVKKSSRYKYCKDVIEKYKNRVITSEEIKEKLYWFCCIPHTTIMVRSNILKKINYNHYRLFEDYDLFYRINKKGYIMDTLTETLVKVRVSNNSTTIRESQGSEFEEVAYEIKKEEIEKMIKDNVPVYIWGTGSFGKNVLNVFNKKNITVAGFIDSNYKNLDKEYNNIPILPPSHLEEQKHLDPKVFIASQPGMFEIANQLEKYGYKHLSDYMVFH
jgi:glycosyltransferase involved in cell wall biosynthesis